MIDIKRRFKQYNNEAFQRLLDHRPDKIDAPMRARGLIWCPLLNEWIKVHP